MLAVVALSNKIGGTRLFVCFFSYALRYLRLHNGPLAQHLGRVDLVPAVGDGGVESGGPVGVVVDGAHVAVGFHQRVLATHDIAVAFLLLVLVVAGQRIVDAVLEGVPRMVVLKM